MQKYTILTLLLVSFGACMHAATLTHRYAFTNNADDSIGDLDGNLTGSNSVLEAPAFISNAIPNNANTNFTTSSIEFGMNVGTLTSAVNFGTGNQTNIFTGVAGSFSYWFWADQLSGNRELVSNVGARGLRTRLLYIENQTVAKVRVTVADIGDVDFTFDSAITAENWHHLVVAWDDPNGTLKIALDGSIRTQAFTANTLTNPARLIAGNFDFGGNNPETQYDGKLFDLQMYQGMLSDEDIELLSDNPGSSLSELSIPEPRHYSLLISLLVLGHMQARRRRPEN